MHTITEDTDEQRVVEYQTSREPHLVTAGGRISTYGMACGYIYSIVSEDEDGWTRLTMGAEGGVYSVDYFRSNTSGIRTKAFGQYEKKNDAERLYRRLATQTRKRGLVLPGDLPNVRVYNH